MGAFVVTCAYLATALQWRHNGRDGVSNHQPPDCLLNRYSSTDQRKHYYGLVFIMGIAIHGNAAFILKLGPIDDIVEGRWNFMCYEFTWLRRLELFMRRKVPNMWFSGAMPRYIRQSYSGVDSSIYVMCIMFHLGIQTILESWQWFILHWRHNGHDGVPNHEPHHCLLNHIFERRSKKTSKLRVTGLCAGNSPVTGEFPAQMASYAENVSIWWRHHV